MTGRAFEAKIKPPSTGVNQFGPDAGFLTRPGEIFGVETGVGCASRAGLRAPLRAPIGMADRVSGLGIGP